VLLACWSFDWIDCEIHCAIFSSCSHVSQRCGYNGSAVTRSRNQRLKTERLDIEIGRSPEVVDREEVMVLQDERYLLFQSNRYSTNSTMGVFSR
jgi:hypothetical protein